MFLATESRKHCLVTISPMAGTVTFWDQNAYQAIKQKGILVERVIHNNPSKQTIWQHAHLVLQGKSRRSGMYTVKLQSKTPRSRNFAGYKLQETSCSSQTQQHAENRLHWAGHTWFLFWNCFSPNQQSLQSLKTWQLRLHKTSTWPSKIQTALNFPSKTMLRSYCG